MCAAYMCVHTLDRNRAPVKREEDIDDHAVAVMNNGMAPVSHMPHSSSRHTCFFEGHITCCPDVL